ncbi:MAG: Amino acid permease [Planctomycetes bacterium ADurb.Bin126]|nr:MAG: Amino acid permease [Planctomycetes bacterium ADurb.Bin126]HOD82557.1 amino acid permease [Phycisphaerae bacterium]HQL73296.1 amino acid permease [Phycisphaerae bacterium]
MAGNSDRVHQGPGDSAPRKFGTFGGVFTPCTLTILGVIMFLRLGQVVGHSGVVYALIIVLISTAITSLTSLSLSAIATNTRVKGGGAYYLISRSLGVEFGGTIGIVFFLAMAISVSLYVIGFTEAFVQTIPPLAGNVTAVATGVNLAVFVCVYIGAGWTIRVQYGILAVLALALVSFYAGAASSFRMAWLQANAGPQFADGESFFTMFALFFPAVTGIMAGANMSGDLENPGRAIPRGTLAAVGATTLVYLSMAVLLGGACPRQTLAGNAMVVQDVALVAPFITAGVFAATLSSALGSMMGAPRILQAFARDDVFRSIRFFAAGSGANNEPRRAIVLTFVIAQACILLGDLNAIAPILTMAFMITYGLLNLATFYESITFNPSYRPTFRYCHWSLSLLGAAGCLGVMFLIHPILAAASIVAMGALHWLIGYREITSNWGDLTSGLILQRSRRNLLRLEEERYHPKNWRPMLLALSGTAWSRTRLAVFANWLTGQRGILTLGQVIEGPIEDLLERRDAQERLLRTFIREQELEAFAAVVVSPDLSAGIEALVQCHGLGAVRPNTILIGWSSDPQRVETMGAAIRLIAGLKRSVLAIRLRGEEEQDDQQDPWEAPLGSIDVWWRGMKNGELMLLLAHLLRQNPAWRSKTIRLLRVTDSPAGREGILKNLTDVLAASRIEAEPVVIVSQDIPGSIHRASRGAALVILGFEPPEAEHEQAFYESMETLAGDLPRVLMVKNAGGMELES